MAGARSALIVATYQYVDPRLRMLKAPQRDAEALAEVLGDPAIGGFEVKTVVNQPSHVISLELAEFFSHRHSDDVLLVHFSCHGVKDDSGELFLAASDTRMDLLEATAVASAFVNKSMTRSRSGCVVLLLDCCYAGAFARGMTRAGSDVDVTDRFGGRGRAVITASTALQLAFEGDELTPSDPEAPGPSVFTRALVDGLRTGEADRDADGIVSLDELYAHVHDEVTRVNPDQTPQKWLFDVAGDLYVARRSTPVTQPSELPAPLVESMESLLAWERQSTIEPLTTLLRGEHPGRSLAARLALERLAENDDSLKVRQAAGAALGSTTVEQAEPPGSVPEVVSPEPVEPIDRAETRAQPVETEPPATATVVPPPDDPVGGSSELPWWRRRTTLVAAGAVLVLVVGGVVVRLVAGPGGGGDGNSGSGTSEPVLASQTLVAESSDHILRLVDIAADGSEANPPRKLHTAEKASGPTVSEDRQWISYQRWPSSAGNASQTRLVRPDGSQDQPLLDKKAAKTCPSSRRPAWSPDSSQVALVCVDTSGHVLGLFEYDLDDHTIFPRVADSTLCCGVTWSGSDLVFGARPSPDAPTRLWTVPAEPGEAKRVLQSAGKDMSFLEPVATEDGKVVVIRAAVGKSFGSLEVATADDSGQTVDLRPVVGEGAGQPTWSPDGTRIAFLSEDPGGGTSLRVVDPSSGQQGPALGGGSFDQVAWGSR